jgi:histone H2A
MEHFEIYIHRVLMQVHPDTRISKDSVLLIQFIVNFVLLKIAHKAVMLVQPIDYEAKTRKTPLGKKTIGSRDIQAAVRLTMPGELVKHAISQGTKAVMRYTSFKPKAGQKSPVKASTKAGLQFSVARTNNLLKRNISLRVGKTAPVYLAAVLEYVAAEILELAGMRAKEKRMRTIMPRHIKEAVVADEELHRLMQDIHVLLPGVKDQPHTKEDVVNNTGLQWVM